MSSDPPQNSGNQEELYALIADLQAELGAAKGPHATWNARWRTLLMTIAQWQIIAEQVRATAQDLNQPLSAIANYADAASQLLRRSESDSPAELQRVLEKLGDQVARAGQLLRNMRMATKYVGPQRVMCDFGQVVSDSLALHLRVLQRENVQLEFPSPPMRVSVEIDVAHIQLVFKHLIQNATEAMEADNTERRRIFVQLNQVNPHEIEVSVRNSGPSIGADEAARIFMPLYTTRPNQLGIGLAICRVIVEAHDGKIFLATEGVDGAEFRFTLPCISDENFPPSE